MQRIDVLRSERKVADAAFHFGERAVPGVRLRAFVGCAAFVIPRPHQLRVSSEALRRGQLFDAMRAPQAAHAAERRQSAFGRDARAGEHEDGFCRLQAFEQFAHVLRGSRRSRTNRSHVSRAFVKEDDDRPERPLPRTAGSQRPNYVTPQGLALMRAALEEAVAGADERDAEYWRSRIASALVVDPRTQPRDIVAFGSTVSLRQAGGSKMSLRIVGEDEADPAAGLDQLDVARMPKRSSTIASAIG